MRECQLCEYKLDVGAAKSEIKELKEKLNNLERDRKENGSAELMPKIQVTHQETMTERPAQQPVSKFFGGGYRLSPNVSKTSKSHVPDLN